MTGAGWVLQGMINEVLEECDFPATMPPLDGQFDERLTRRKIPRPSQS